MLKTTVVAAAVFAATGWIALAGATSANADTTKCDDPVYFTGSGPVGRDTESVTRCKWFADNGDYGSYEIYCDANGCESTGN